MKVERLFKEKKRLVFKIIAAYAKITCLRKQYRAVMKKLRDLDNRENRNILKLEINKIITDNLSKTLQEKVISSKALNFFSPRFFFFLNPTLLDSPGKNVKMLQDSS
jgi:hypothetical protein